MSLTGHATVEGTARYRDRFKDRVAENHFRYEQDLWLSSIGLGTYLGSADEATDANYTNAMVRAVEMGLNVIDTAANYRFQRSERSIGEALTQLTSKQDFSRDEMVICTKCGYLPFDGAPPRDVSTYIKETFVRPGIAKPEDFVGGSHCMKPAYLRHQLEQSLRNTGLTCLDVYYVHNPESELGFVSQAEFYARLRSAFEEMERSIAEGKIRMYGVATWNGFRVPSDSREYHSLSRMVELAREVGGDAHGFRFIQLPFNLAMTEALTLRNQTIDGLEAGEQVSVLEAAGALGITMVASASILQGRVAHGLPESIREPLGGLATDAQTAIQFVRSTPGINIALVGMRKREHVEENLQLVHVEPVHPEDFSRMFLEE
ncbi:MAG: aldo/keto reductase [Pyrinomonadaceae bacterium]